MLEPWSLGPCFGSHFGFHFWRVRGSFLEPKWGPKSDFFGIRFWLIFGSNFYRIWGPFWSPKRSKRDQHGLQKRSKRAIIAKRGDFEKVCFDMFFAGILEHQAYQEWPKRAKKASKMVPGSLPDLFKKRFHFPIPFFRFSGPILGSQIRLFRDPFLVIFWVQFLSNLGAILEPKTAQKGPRRLPKAVQESYDSEKKRFRTGAF